MGKPQRLPKRPALNQKLHGRTIERVRSILADVENLRPLVGESKEVAVADVIEYFFALGYRTAHDGKDFDE